jgi:hypothetical protein
MFDTGLIPSASTGKVAVGVGPSVGFEVADGCSAGKVAVGVGPRVGFEVADGCSVIDGRLAV